MPGDIDTRTVERGGIRYRVDVEHDNDRRLAIRPRPLIDAVDIQ